jgi:hypothetical protein
MALIADLHCFQGLEGYGGNVNQGIMTALIHCIDSI